MSSTTMAGMGSVQIRTISTLAATPGMATSPRPMSLLPGGVLSFERAGRIRDLPLLSTTRATDFGGGDEYEETMAVWHRAGPESDPDEYELGVNHVPWWYSSDLWG